MWWDSAKKSELGWALTIASFSLVNMVRLLEALSVVKCSHIGAAGMRSELTFERGGTVV